MDVVVDIITAKRNSWEAKPPLRKPLLPELHFILVLNHSAESFQYPIHIMWGWSGRHQIRGRKSMASPVVHCEIGHQMALY